LVRWVACGFDGSLGISEKPSPVVSRYDIQGNDLLKTNTFCLYQTLHCLHKKPCSLTESV